VSGPIRGRGGSRDTRSPHRPRCFAPCSDTLLRPYADTIILSESSVQLGRSATHSQQKRDFYKRCNPTNQSCPTYQLSSFLKKFKVCPTQQISTTTIKRILTKRGHYMTRTVALTAKPQHSGTPIRTTTTPLLFLAKVPPLETLGTPCCTTST